MPVNAKGAPEAIIALCDLDAAEQAEWLDQVRIMAERGLRVIGVATGQWASETLAGEARRP